MEHLSKILVPLDFSDHCRRAVTFTGCLAAGLGDRIKEIRLLHVLAGGYLSEHMGNIDIRAAKLIKSEEFGKLRRHHVETTVTPLFSNARAEITRLGATAAVSETVVDGTPAQEIARLAEAEAFSTIVICRRGMSETKEFLLGSVTASLLHRVQHPTIYVVGTRLLAEEGACLLPRILVLLDGSPHSLAALHETAVMARAYGQGLEQVTLLHVIDLATIGGEQLESGDITAAAEKILDQGRDILLANGVAQDKIHPLAVYGDPARTAMEVAEREQTTLVMVGRKGRSKIQDLLIGGVSNTILHRLAGPTIGVVCAA